MFTVLRFFLSILKRKAWFWHWQKKGIQHKQWFFIHIHKKKGWLSGNEKKKHNKNIKKRLQKQEKHSTWNQNLKKHQNLNQTRKNITTYFWVMWICVWFSLRTGKMAYDLCECVRAFYIPFWSVIWTIYNTRTYSQTWVNGNDSIIIN